MNISYKTTSDYFEVTVPFAVKSTFKNIFKTAKWNSDKKVWLVNNTTASQTKLDKIINGVDVVKCKELKDKEVTVATIAQLNKDIENNINVISREIKLLIQEQNHETYIKEAQELLLQQADKLKTVKAEVEELKKQNLQKEQDLINSVNAVMDLSELREVAYKMKKEGYEIRSYNKDKFYEYKEEIRVMRESLRKTGLDCTVLSEIIGANWNRAKKGGRDDIGNVDLSDTNIIKHLVKYVPEE